MIIDIGMISPFSDTIQHFLVGSSNMLPLIV
jgi:hypothetical protein